MFWKDGLKMSRSKATVRAVSSYTIDGTFSLGTLTMLSSHRFTNVFNSWSSSATRFPSEEVRTITLKFFGLMLWINCRKRARSSLDLIFVETETLSANGINTMYLPANDSSEVSRGPFVEIGSLAICTNTSCPTLSTLLMLPSFSISGSICTFEMAGIFLGSPSACLRNFCWVLKLGPKSR